MIYQRLRLPSPTELGDDPQLAVLTVLITNLEMASFALLSVYPDLDGHPDYPDPHAARHEQEAYASSIVKQVRALVDIVQEYLSAVQRGRSWKSRRSSCAKPAS